MSWQRLINRNGLKDGDYGQAPERWASLTNTSAREPLPPEAFDAVPEGEREAVVLNSTQSLSNHRAERVIRYENQAKSLAGDLRRLEKDIVDEGALCKEIARKVNMDADIVAAVLKEFVSV
jgi:hypothetical protein